MRNSMIVILVLLIPFLFVSCDAVGLNLSPAEDIPVLYINTPNNIPINSKEWINKAQGLGLSTFQIAHANLYDTDVIEMDIRGRGNSTWEMPKKPYNISLDSKEALFGMTNHKKWVLLANYADKTLLRTDFALGLGRDVFDNLEWTSNARSVELILNDQYQGVYQVVEKIEIDKDRLNIDVKSENSTDFLLERDHRIKDEEYKFDTNKGLRLSWEKTTKNLNNVDQINYIIDRVQEIEDLIFSYADIEDIKGDIDLPSFIDWYLVNELTKNVDAQKYSSIFLYQKNNKLFMGPLWDFDLSSGNANYHTCDDPEGFYIYDEDNAWYYELFQDSAFVGMVQDRWNERKDLVLEHISQIRAKAGELENAQSNNFKRWRILGKYVWPNPVWSNTYQGEIDYLTEWLETRYQWLDENINALT